MSIGITDSHFLVSKYTIGMSLGSWGIPHVESLNLLERPSGRLQNYFLYSPLNQDSKSKHPWGTGRSIEIGTTITDVKDAWP